jgi:hypothetical protein
MKAAAVALLVALVSVCAAAAATPVRVSVAGKLTSPVAKRPWTLRLAVRPAFRGTIRTRRAPAVRGTRNLRTRLLRAQLVGCLRRKFTARAG